MDWQKSVVRGGAPRYAVCRRLAMCAKSRSVKNPEFIAGWMLLLGVVTLTVFWPATRGAFVNFDDGAFVAQNPHVLTGLSAENVRWAFTAVHESWWLPVLWLSYMLDAEFFGAGPFGFHFTNILLHAANTLLLFWVLWRLTGARGRSLLVAALFALHPLRVESVAWVTARKDVLSGLFLLLALAAYAGEARRPAGLRWGRIACLMLLGLMSKATVIVLPVLLLLLDFWPLRRAEALRGAEAWRQWKSLLREKIPFMLLTLVFVGVNLYTHRANVAGPAGLDITSRVALAGTNFWAYLAKTAWPAGLTVYYPEHDVVRWLPALAAATGLLAGTLGALRVRATRPYVLVGWLWFLLALVPVIRGLRLGPTAMANRFTYLPAIGLNLAAVWWLADLSRERPRLRRALLVLAGAVLAAGIGLTVYNLRFWQNSETLFRHALAIHPGNYVAAKNLADHYGQAGRSEEAHQYLELAAAAGRDRLPDAAGVVGDALRQLGRIDEAGAVYEAAMRADQDPPGEILNNLGLIRFQQGRADEAVDLLRRALAVNPKLPDAQFNLGLMLFQLDRPAEALAVLEEALRLNPRDHAAHFLAGQVLAAQGRQPDARLHFETACRLQPGNPDYRAAAAGSRPRPAP